MLMTIYYGAVLIARLAVTIALFLLFGFFAIIIMGCSWVLRVLLTHLALGMICPRHSKAPAIITFLWIATMEQTILPCGDKYSNKFYNRVYDSTGLFWFALFCIEHALGWMLVYVVPGVNPMEVTPWPGLSYGLGLHLVAALALDALRFLDERDTLQLLLTERDRGVVTPSGRLDLEDPFLPMVSRPLLGNARGAVRIALDGPRKRCALHLLGTDLALEVEDRYMFAGAKVIFVKCGRDFNTRGLFKVGKDGTLRPHKRTPRMIGDPDNLVVGASAEGQELMLVPAEDPRRLDFAFATAAPAEASDDSDISNDEHQPACPATKFRSNAETALALAH